MFTVTLKPNRDRGAIRQENVLTLAHFGQRFRHLPHWIHKSENMKTMLLFSLLAAAALAAPEARFRVNIIFNCTNYKLNIEFNPTEK